AVLVYPSNPFNDAQALGDVLADYVDAGFGVVASADSFEVDDGLRGRLVSEHYLPFTQGHYGRRATLTLIADDSLHPLLAGVNSFRGGESSYRETSLSLNPGATL